MIADVSWGKKVKEIHASDYVGLREVGHMIGISRDSAARRFRLGMPGVVDWSEDGAKNKMIRVLKSAVISEKRRRMGRRK